MHRYLTDEQRAALRARIASDPALAGKSAKELFPLLNSRPIVNGKSPFHPECDRRPSIADEVLGTGFLIEIPHPPHLPEHAHRYTAPGTADFLPPEAIAEIL